MQIHNATSVCAITTNVTDVYCNLDNVNIGVTGSFRGTCSKSINDNIQRCDVAFSLGVKLWTGMLVQRLLSA